MFFKPAQQSLNNLKHVEVIDVLMGSGKTYASLRYIESLVLANKQVKWVFCTEFLSEIATRTVENEEAKHLWRTPEKVGEETKMDDFINLLEEPNVQLIAITHNLLKSAANNVVVQSLVAKNGWCLFLDETIEVISPYNGINYSEFMWHKDAGRISLDDGAYGRVQWLDDSVLNYDTKEMAIGRMLKAQDNLYAYINGKQLSLVAIEPKVMFTMWHRVILSTYQFEDTLMDAYFKMKQIDWKPCTDIVCCRLATKAEIKANITMINKYNPAWRNTAFSSGWYEEKATADDYKELNKTIRNIGDAFGCKGKPELFGYTLPKSALGKRGDKKKIQPVGYKHTVCLIDADGEAIEGTVDKRRSGHIPCNARASNEYASKTVMVHAYDRHPNVGVTNYLRGVGVSYSKERFAVNELVQWLWRSAIRNGQPIHVAILSKRMRDLFINWLDN